MKFHEKPGSYVSNVVLRVANIERSKRFYQELMGFSILSETENEIVFTVNGKDSILIIQSFANIAPMQMRRTGLYHFAILLPTRTDLAKFIRHLIKSDYPLHGAADHAVSEALYFNDPDGHGIEVYVDRKSETWTWANDEVYMTTEQLDIGDIMTALDGTSWTKAPELTVMGHIHLHVRDLNETEKFYRDVLGLDVVSRFNGQALFMSFDKYHHHIGLNTWNGIGAAPQEETNVGLEYFTIRYGTEKMMKEVKERLVDQYIDFKTETNSLTVVDPSKNKIRLTW